MPGTLLGLGTALPAAASSQTYTLSGVTFTDGTVANGFFTFDPTARTFGAVDITTTPLPSVTLHGNHYTPFVAAFPPGQSSSRTDAFTFFSDNSLLTLVTGARDTSLGTVALTPGVAVVGGIGINSGSGEDVDFVTSSSPGIRLVTQGSLVVTLTPPPVPEPSSVAAFGMTALGIGGLILRARKRSGV